MAWDSTRPVPWQRLMREWAIYAMIMSAIFLLFVNNGSPVGAIAGVLISGPLYLGFGWVLAKFGYHRKTLTELRSEREQSSASKSSSMSSSSSDDAADSRRPVAPTSRTSGGGNRPTAKKKRRR